MTMDDTIVQLNRRIRWGMAVLIAGTLIALIAPLFLLSPIDTLGTALAGGISEQSLNDFRNDLSDTENTVIALRIAGSALIITGILVVTLSRRKRDDIQSQINFSKYNSDLVRRNRIQQGP